MHDRNVQRPREPAYGLVGSTPHHAVARENEGTTGCLDRLDRPFHLRAERFGDKRRLDSQRRLVSALSHL